MSDEGPLGFKDQLMIEIAYCRHVGLPVSEEADRIVALVNKAKEPVDCPHADGPFRFCHTCPVQPCPLGLSGQPAKGC